MIVDVASSKLCFVAHWCGNSGVRGLHGGIRVGTIHETIQNSNEFQMKVVMAFGSVRTYIQDWTWIVHVEWGWP